MTSSLYATVPVWPHTIVQTCVIHLIRNSFRLVPRKHWDALRKDLKAIYTAPTPDAAAIALDELDEKWGKQYGAMMRLWRNAWEQFIPFLDYDVEIRKLMCSTNAIESLNARYRRAIRARGHFPTEQAAPDGRCAGNQSSTRSPSPSVTAGRPLKPTNNQRRNTVRVTDPIAHAVGCTIWRQGG